jgi:hypothetical protein
VILQVLQMMLRIWCLTWKNYFYKILFCVLVTEGSLK